MTQLHKKRLLGLVLLFSVFFCFTGFSQDEKDTTLKKGERLYQFDMKYTGSEFQVDPYYKYMLANLVEMAQKDPTLHIHVRGHVCCGPGKRLSRRRARKTYKYLKQAGVNKTQLSFKGYSDKAPLRWPEKTEEDKAANRRVDFILSNVR